MTAATLAAPSGVWRREVIAELKRTSRLPQFLLPTVLTPAAFFGLFSMAVARSPSPAYVAAMLAGYGVFAATGPALFGFGAGVAMEREQGLIELKRVSPMPAGAYVVAKLAATIMTTAIALILIDALALVAGVRLSAAIWARLTILHLAAAIPFALIGFGVGMRMSGKGAVAIANALFLGGSVLGGLWIPSSVLPGWMRTLGEVTPSYHLSQLARAIMGAETIGSPVAHAAAVAAITLAGAVWAWSGWRRSPA
ncbi:ABC transporter permease [Sphingomonas naphthae]|uniref:ABC transporter permease n=1 Tax=Sphingomonas naphthae TaxID=1813468 RepID=A0ABY7TGA4_9SPHN|nr:ABC transporter permease [Sphingomonas naphthae]WCT72258.1 ABC transporter permease [Sphingomonas naphthae]